MNKALKPCPFCGGKGEIKNEIIWGEHRTYVRCKECFCRTDYIVVSPSYCSEEKAAERWNMRYGGEQEQWKKSK